MIVAVAAHVLPEGVMIPVVSEGKFVDDGVHDAQLGVVTHAVPAFPGPIWHCVTVAVETQKLPDGVDIPVVSVGKPVGEVGEVDVVVGGEIVDDVAVELVPPRQVALMTDVPA